VEKLVEQLGVTRLSKSQVSETTRQLDAQVGAFRNRTLDTGPYPFVWIDALTQKVREDGRTVVVHALVATGVNADGHREILGLDVVPAEDGADDCHLGPARRHRRDPARRELAAVPHPPRAQAARDQGSLVVRR
jgi:transposase-like protein